MAVRVHLEECRPCADIVRAYQSTVAELALLTPLYRAPSSLGNRVMGGVSGRSFGIVPFLRSTWVSAAAALLIIGFAIGAVVWAVRVSSEVTQLREDNDRLAEVSELDSAQRDALLSGLQGDLNSAKTEQKKLVSTLEEQATLIQVALDPDLIPTALKGTYLAPGANCNYVWSTKQLVGALTCKSLPTTSFGLTYELWAMKGDQLIPVGTFNPTIEGTAQLLVKFPPDVEGEVQDLWVTLERLQSPPASQPHGSVILTRTPEQQAIR
jgi:hypothetical protein